MEGPALDLALAKELLYLVFAVLILWKCADWFVEGAVGVAERMHVPQMLVGMVLVSIATTSPELMTSLMAALKGRPETALGNAVGSVVIDASVALGLAAVVSLIPLRADPGIFRTTAAFLLFVIGCAFVFTLNGTLGRAEGALLVGMYATYTVYSYIQVKRRKEEKGIEPEEIQEEVHQIEEKIANMSLGKIAFLFGVGFAGVLFGSHLLLLGAEGIALRIGMSNVVMGLTVTAIGTSTPEIATCVTAARKGAGGIGIGNILGADVLNICWVAGLSAVAHPLTAEKVDVYFMFPAVFVVVGAMLLMLRRDYQLTRGNGMVLLGLAIAFYAVLFGVVVPNSGGEVAL